MMGLDQRKAEITGENMGTESRPAKFFALATIALAIAIGNGGACQAAETSVALRGSGSVFNDAVYWFRGGMDKNGNGVMDGGEAFDDLHANDANHANHDRMAVSGWMENCEFVTEDVVLPGELNPGWNTMRFATEDTDNCLWSFDYFRLKATLPKGFSIPPMGLRIMCR